jgi:riboflavin synthase
MFTGIIEGVGEIKNIEGNLFTITHPFGEGFAVGESVAISGMCATVLRSDEHQFEVEIIEESRRLTIFGSAEIGTVLNLERSAIIGTRNSGHNVTGHIDQVGKIEKLERQGDYWLVRVQVQPENRKLLVHKGSVALSGISLTVSGVSDLNLSEAWFEVSIISHTWAVTNLNRLQIGTAVNVEFDVLGKYALNQKV